jgi:hypothetical protein
MNKKNVFGVLFVFAVVLSGCASATFSSEYRTLKNEVEGIKAEIDSLLTQSGDLNDLDAKLTELNDEGYVLSEEASALLSVPSRRKAAVTKLGLPACKAYSYARFNLLDDYDDASTNDFLKALELGIGFDNLPWSRLIRNEASYAGQQAINQFITEVNFDGCYSTNFRTWLDDVCQTFDRMMLKKDINAFDGQCLKGRVKIAQSDALTGPCGFQGYINGDYDVRAQFGFTLDAATHSTSTDCISEAKKLTEGRFIEFAGFAIGLHTYTTSNGSNTIPAFKIVFAD